MGGSSGFREGRCLRAVPLLGQNILGELELYVDKYGRVCDFLSEAISAKPIF